jgi:hypothetical protein
MHVVSRVAEQIGIPDVFFVAYVNLHQSGANI